MDDQAILTTMRNDKTKNAIVFVHGFGGDSSGTWGNFPQYLMESPALKGWDIYSLGYKTGLAPDFKGLWSGNPSVTTIASYIHTHAFRGDLDRYKALVFIAHSMGGLVVQRALLDYKDLLARTTHVFLFGTPSAGLRKAGWFKWFKRQVDDLADDGAFVPKLRADWEQLWPKEPPPKFWTVAGDSDEFVPASSSLGPFPIEQRFVVPGNHLEIVKPANVDDLPVEIIVKGIQGKAAPAGPWNTARVALQMLDFRKAVETLKPLASELDDAHLIQLAIAMDSLGHMDEALEILSRSKKLGTDARGVLAGRFKRRWIASGRAADFDRALELYTSAYDEAVANDDHSQAFYHGINICFLMVADADKKTDPTDMLNKVLKHCEQADQDFWCLGTKGEALLCLGNKEEALAAYSASVNMSPEPEPWQLASMHSQACQLAAILDFDELTSELDKIFRQEVDSE